MMVGLQWERIQLGLQHPRSARGAARRSEQRLPADYAVPNVAEKIVRIIVSYTDYVNRTVWQKPAV